MFPFSPLDNVEAIPPTYQFFFFSPQFCDVAKLPIIHKEIEQCLAIDQL